MKKLFTIIGCALVAQVINTFAGPTSTSWEEIARENDRDQQMDVIRTYNDDLERQFRQY